MSEMSLRAQFFNDALEVLADAEEYVLQLENEGFDEDTVHSLFRLFHTLKGNSNMVGEGEISSLTHALESQYDAVRNNKVELNSELLQSTFEVIDLLNMVCQEGDSGPHTQQISEMTQSFESPLRKSGRGEERETGGAARQGSQGGTASGTAGSGDRGGSSSGSASAAGKVTGAEPEAGGASAHVRLTPDEQERLATYEQWRPILTAFYELEKHANRMAESSPSGDWEDILLDLGMAAIELRSAVDEASEYLDRTAVYIEKFTSTVSREQIPYSAISYELLYLLLNDFRRGMWERLYLLGVLRHFRIDSVDALDEVVTRIQEEGVLYVVELAFKKDTFLREAPLFGKLEKVKQTAPERVVLISPRFQLMQKATALLDQALEGFPQIALNIEEGVKNLLITEE